jgi:RNAse (barnase) inhibitor barstar
MSNMPEIILDAADWKCADDVYNAFFAAVGAPSWHGRNLDALNDSIATGEINKVEVPYRLIVRNAASAGPDARQLLNHFAELIHSIQAEGCPVAIDIVE